MGAPNLPLAVTRPVLEHRGDVQPFDEYRCAEKMDRGRLRRLLDRHDASAFDWDLGTAAVRGCLFVAPTRPLPRWLVEYINPPSDATTILSFEELESFLPTLVEIKKLVR